MKYYLVPGSMWYTKYTNSSEAYFLTDWMTDYPMEYYKVFSWPINLN